MEVDVKAKVIQVVPRGFTEEVREMAVLDRCQLVVVLFNALSGAAASTLDR